MSQQSLTAFYDLDVSPVSYDFAIFLILLEMERRSTGATLPHLVIVPPDDGGFRSDDAEYDSANKHWRLHNILLPLCAAAPSPLSVTLCRSREEAVTIEKGLAGSVFPEGYSTARPTSAFMWSHIASASAREESIPHLRSSPQARRFMKSWLADHCDGRRPVSITLRESSHAVARNSNISAWLDFACSLDKTLYCPVIIRDTEKIFYQPEPSFSGLQTCPLASLHVDLRLALYEMSWLNLGIPNGPTALFWLSSRIRFLMFGMLNTDSPATSAVYIASQGLPHGGQLPHATAYQRLVWEPDKIEVIKREFFSMADRIGDLPADNEAISDPANAEDPITVALRLQMTGRLEEAVAIYQDIVTKDPNNADAWHMLGIIALQAERADAAEKMIMRAIRLNPERANYFINLAAVLKKLERSDEATNCLWRAIALAPNDAGAHADLAELLYAQGESDKAKAALLKAMQIKPKSRELCERAARVLHAMDHVTEAASLYRRALELREEEQRQAAKLRDAMPEIPVVTLKTG